MLDADQAMGKAWEYLERFIPDFAALQPKVEEIVFAADSSAWNIRLYAYRGGERSEGATLADLLRFRRIEKVVSVSAQDGALIAISNPAPASLAS